MRKAIVILPILLALVITIPALAQDGDDRLILNLRRNFGYSAAGRIQGRFTVSTDGPNNLESVRYSLDGEFFAESSEPPFKFSFSTNEYALGKHTLLAIGTMASGEEIYSEEKSMEFISADESWQQAIDIVVPLIVGIGVIMALGILLQTFMGRRAGSFVLGKYGPSGGVVCPGCSLPYSRHFLSPNLVFGKLERCPHCGKWAIVPRASRVALEEAEERFRSDAETGLLEQGAQRSQSQVDRQLEDTRYYDI